MTTGERLEKLENKLAVAEGALRRTRRMLGVGALVVLGCLAMAAIQDRQVIRARKFIVMDDQGRERIVLAASTYTSTVALYDENGKERAGFGVGKEGPVLALAGANGSDRLRLNVLNDVPLLRLFDASEKLRVGLGILKDGGPTLQLLDEKERIRSTFSDSNTGPGLAMTDENGKARIGLLVIKDGPDISVMDKNGKAIWGNNE